MIFAPQRRVKLRSTAAPGSKMSQRKSFAASGALNPAPPHPQHTVIPAQTGTRFTAERENGKTSSGATLPAGPHIDRRPTPSSTEHALNGTWPRPSPR